RVVHDLVGDAHQGVDAADVGADRLLQQPGGPAEGGGVLLDHGGRAALGRLVVAGADGADDSSPATLASCRPVHRALPSAGRRTSCRSAAPAITAAATPAPTATVGESGASVARPTAIHASPQIIASGAATGRLP